MSNPRFRFEIAISFAGDSKRDLIRSVAELLVETVGKGKVFLDEWFEAELAGPDAHLVLQDIYQNRTCLVVYCVCQCYNKKPWPQEEWRAIQVFERDLRDANTGNVQRLRLLPLRFSDGVVDGMFPTAIVPDVRNRTAEQIADLILSRHRLAGLGRQPLDSDEDDQSSNMLVSRLSHDNVVAMPKFVIEGIAIGKDFINRSHEIERGEDLILKGNQFLIVGPPRIGKTSYCYELMRRCAARAGGSTFAMRVDIQGMGDNLSARTFYEFTLYEIIGEIAMRVFEADYSHVACREDAVPSRLRHDPNFMRLRNLRETVRAERVFCDDSTSESVRTQEFVRFTRDLVEIVRATKSWERFVIFYDEANRLESQRAIALVASNATGLAASHFQSVFVASHEMAIALRTTHAIDGPELRLGRFESSEQVAALVKEYYLRETAPAEQVPITPKAIGRVWDESLGVPLLMQLILYETFRLAHNQGAVEVTTSHVDAAVSWLSTHHHSWQRYLRLFGDFE